MRHPFVACFLVLAAIDVLIVVAAACARAVVCRGRPLAFHTLAIWSIVVLSAHAANELALSAGAIRAVIAAVVIVALAALGALRRPRDLPRAVADQRGEIVLVLAALGAQILLYLVPLIGYPAGTLITAEYAGDDALHHAVLMGGYDLVHRVFGQWSYLGAYPDGFHALVFSLSPWFPSRDAPTFLLPAAIWGASFLALPVLMIVRAEARALPDTTAALIAASPAGALLLTTSVYLYFVGHMAALPVIAGAVVIAVSWSVDEAGESGAWLLALAPAAASLAMYGLLAASLFGCALALRMSLVLWRPRSIGARIRAWLPTILRPSTAAAVGATVILTVPAIRQIVHGYDFFSSQASTDGNLPGGALNPLHVTGFWKIGADYRSPLTGADSFTATFLAAVLVLEVLIVARLRWSRAAVLAMAAFTAPVIATAGFAIGPYIHFKYLTMLTGVWVPVAVLALARGTAAATGRRWTSAPAVLAAVVVMALAGAPSFRQFHPLTGAWFDALKAARDLCGSDDVLVLSRENWFQYYRHAGDVDPFAAYFHQDYGNQPVQRVILDTVFRPEAVGFLNAHWPGAAVRLRECWGVTVGGRLRVYDFACLTSPGAVP